MAASARFFANLARCSLLIPTLINLGNYLDERPDALFDNLLVLNDVSESIL